MNAYLSGVGSSDLTRQLRAAVGKSSTYTFLLESAASRGVSLNVSHPWTVQRSGNSTCLHFRVDGEVGVVDS